MPDGLRLDVTEYADRTRWRWVLTDASGSFLADHEVRLDKESWQFEAFTDLQGYISWHAAPDKRPAEEARIVTALGDWIGAEVFGPAIGNALLAHKPVILEAILPTGAEALAYLPLETARLQSRSLAGHDITLVIHPPAANGVRPKTSRTTGNLRVLGLFSLPEGGTALNLRRERQSLVTLINKIAASGRAAEVKVLQYGVTRDRLRDILYDGEGWDIVHISGHGVPGELILETADGRPDRISAADLAELLEVTRDRIKLVTVSACWSAALATAEPRRLLGLPAPENQRDFSPERPEASPPVQHPASGDIATILASRLGCAVLAMRFPVGDEFAIELAERLYGLFIGEGEPLPRAVARTLRQFTESGRALQFPALSMAAPAIFGATATSPTLRAPATISPASSAAENPKMAGFPPQPDRFVGRTAVMTRAAAALAPDSGIPGVVLHGMPGGGKTACALELAYTHQDVFDTLLWFKTPDEGAAIDASLTDFALTLERNLPDLEMIDKVVTAEALTAFLPKLTELMEQNRLLLVIDNAGSLLSDTGQWHDDRWHQVVEALTSHKGLSRLVMTTRHVPAEVLAMRVEPVDALHPDEALLLTRELPNLRALIWGKLPGLDSATARNLALGILDVAHGHPKLLELADGQASHPEQLTALVQAGGQAWQEQGKLPHGFFTADAATTKPSDYLNVLAAWTNTVADTLSPGERDLFWFLCCLEEADRFRLFVKIVWSPLWQKLGREGSPPELDQSLAAVAICGLVTLQKGTDGKRESYGILPGVAAAARDYAGKPFQNAVDEGAAVYWLEVLKHASGNTGNHTVHSDLAVRAGLGAVPYLIRQGHWLEAAITSERAFILEPSRRNAAILLPAAREITRHEPSMAGQLASILQALGESTAEQSLRAAMSDALARRDHLAAMALAERLARQCMHSGKLGEALAFAEQMAEHSRLASLGPWTVLAADVRRLEVLGKTENPGKILLEAQRLHRYAKTLSIDPGPPGSADPQVVQDTLYEIGGDASLRLGRWDLALKFNATFVTRLASRHEPADTIAIARFNDYGPLLRLGRTEEALTLLLDCKRVFQDAGNIAGLARSFMALADIEESRGHGDAAIRLVRDALRYHYQIGDVISIASAYHSLGGLVAFHIRQHAPALANHLIAAVIRTLADVGGTDDESAAGSLRAAASALRASGMTIMPPVNIADLCRRVSDIPGTNPAGLIAKLSPVPATAERILRDLIAQARELAAALPADTNPE